MFSQRTSRTSKEEKERDGGRWCVVVCSAVHVYVHNIYKLINTNLNL